MDLQSLFRKDELKTDAIAELSQRQIAQEQRCDDREKSCLGKQACKRIEKHMSERQSEG